MYASMASHYYDVNSGACMLKIIFEGSEGVHMATCDMQRNLFPVFSLFTCTDHMPL